MAELREESLILLANTVGATIAKQFYGYVTADDLAQQCWLWILTHEHKITEYLDGDEPDIGSRKLATCLYHEALRYAQQEKAVMTGYRTEDLYYYSIRTLRNALPIWYEQGYDVGEGPRVYDTDREREIWPDISRGMAALSAGDRRLIEQAFNGDHYSPAGTSQESGKWAAMAIAEGINTNSLHTRVSRALRRLQKQMGGERPREYQEDAA